VAEDPRHCSQQTGVPIQRQNIPAAQMLPKILQGTGSRTLPNLLFMDNPTVQQIASTGALKPLSDTEFPPTVFPEHRPGRHLSDKIYAWRRA